MAIKNRNIQKARHFGHMFCFIDDLSAIIDDLEFEKNCKDIYHSEQWLRKGSIPKSEASLLDLLIVNENKKLKTKLFNRRDTFPFSIVRIPRLDRNTLSKLYHASMCSQILKSARPTSDSNTFVTLSNQL